MTSKTPPPTTYELQLGDDIKRLELGLTKMCAVGYANGRLLELLFYNGKVEPIKVPYGKDLVKTGNDVKQALINSHQFDDKIKKLGEFVALLTESINELKQQLLSEAKRASEEKKSAYEEATIAKISKCKADIERVKNAAGEISPEVWRIGLVERYNELRRVVNENIPEIWQGLEFELSSLRILNIHECTLPFIGIILGRPSSCKTAILNLLKSWYCTFYTDSFSPKSWITHTTAVDSEEELSKIDMLPKVKDKHFLTPELAPIFTTDEKDLGFILGTITRIADGHGLASDSGAHGHREHGNTMFVWTGAAVDIPHNVYKLLSGLGFKLYFHRLSYKDKTDEELFQSTSGIFSRKMTNIESALYDYLAWFEIGPNLIQDEQSGLCKMQWDDEKNEKEAIMWIIKLARLLGRLRCIAQTWRDKSDNTGSTWGYSVTQPESPERAIEVLKNLARGHALSTGRNFIMLEDIPIIVKTVLSTAHLDKVGLMFFLISNKGRALTKDIEKFLNVTRPTALRNMTELEVTGLVDSEDEEVSASGTSRPRTKTSIILKKEFDWLLKEEFQKLRNGFEPVDNRAFMDKDSSEQLNDPPNGSRVNNYPFSLEHMLTFQRIFGELEEIERNSNPGPGMEVDKTTVPGETLRDMLVASGKFTTSDAAIVVEYMKQAGFIEQPAWDTYRRKILQ